MTDEMIEGGNENRVYEVSYLLLPSIPEEQVPTHVAEIKKMIEGAGGQFISEEDPKLRHLAYEMIKLVGTRNERYKTAYFGWVKYEAPAQSAIDLKVLFDAKEEILRHLIIKTVREDTFVPTVVEEEEILDTPEALVAEAVEGALPQVEAEKAPETLETL